MKKTILILLLVIVSLFIYKEQKNSEVIIPDSAIRLRVIPNSNSTLDQKIKIEVKDYLEKDIYEELKNISNIAEARNVIKKEIPSIEENIDEIFTKNNYDMNYVVNYGNNYFPKKEYRGIKYKEGYYESIVIEIGKGEGDNWWCVLFPNLCLIDLEKKEDTEYKFWIIETINKIF